MKSNRIDLTISTEKLQESKNFYMEHFNFKLMYESDWYIELLAPSINVGISFTLPQREEGEFFNGRGLILSLEVNDVVAEYERIKAEGLLIYQEIQEKPWGEKSFVINDPNGVHVYIYEAIEPTPEYKQVYDSYK